MCAVVGVFSRIAVFARAVAAIAVFWAFHRVFACFLFANVVATVAIFKAQNCVFGWFANVVATSAIAWTRCNGFAIVANAVAAAAAILRAIEWRLAVVAVAVSAVAILRTQNGRFFGIAVAVSAVAVVAGTVLWTGRFCFAMVASAVATSRKTCVCVNWCNGRDRLRLYISSICDACVVRLGRLIT